MNAVQGNANIGVALGSVAAGYRDTTATSEAIALDLGVLPTLLGGEKCDGGPPTFNPVTLPPVTRSSSAEPSTRRSPEVEVFVPGLYTDPAGGTIGWQEATTTAAPSAWASTRSVETDVLVVHLIGGRAEATASLDRSVREARAVVEADELRVFGNLFRFHKPRWEAVARSGEATLAQGSFTFERATVLGQPRSPTQAMADLEGFRLDLERLLRPFGVRLDLPTVRSENGRVQVTPMEFRIENMPLGSEAIAPVLGRAQPLKEALYRRALEENCRNTSRLFLLDVLLGILAGSGSVEIAAGGVDVTTADTDFSAPPLPPIPVDTTTDPPPPPSELTPATPQAPLESFDPPELGPDWSGDGFSTGFTTDDLSSAAIPAEVMEAAELTEVAAATDTADRVRTGVAPSRAPGVRQVNDRVAAMVGSVLLAGALLLTAGDRLAGRRRTRRIL